MQQVKRSANFDSSTERAQAVDCMSRKCPVSRCEDGTIEEMRRKVRHDASFGVPEIDVESFVTYILPPLKAGINAEDVVASLKRDGLITSEERWRHFEVSPAERPEDEDVVFASLAEICTKSMYHVSTTTGHEPTLVLTLLPSTTTNSHSESPTRPDGYFILREAECRAQAGTSRMDRARWWYDIALTTEFKKNGSTADVDDNVNKLVFNIQQVMTLDPCRRFVFGITVENTKMRLWFCSRGTAVVSREFDFTTEVNVLTRVLLSFVFASKEDLGWDPTIRPCPGSDGKRQYEIDVENETYVTENLLSDSAADALISRGTRVWKTRSLSSGQSVVVKDVWIEDDRELEHITHDMILRDVEEEYGLEVRKEVVSHLLNPVAHWLVTVNGEEDHTTNVMMRGYKPSLKQKFNLKTTKSKKTDVTSAGSTVASDKTMGSTRRELRAPFPRLYRRKYFHRRHYRIVFKEVADTLSSVRHLSNVFSVLRDSTKVLTWIHGCGWVHRDISVGNLYFYDGRGVIGDFEFANRKNCDVAQEARIGTSDFMAIEAAKCGYRYRPVEGFSKIRAEVSAWLASGAKDFPLKQTSNRSPPFFHNDLHDLESLWWVAIWELVFHWDSSEMKAEEEHAEELDMQRESAISDLFPNTGVLDDRRLFFEDDAVYEERLAWMSENLLDVKRVLNALRESLIHEYEKFEAQFPVVNTDTLQEAHAIFEKLFDVCTDFAAGIELTPYKRIAVRQSLLGYRDDIRDVREPAVPSLEQDADGEVSDDSFADETDGQDPIFFIGGAIGPKWGGGKHETLEEDFLTPVPSLCVARYELQAC